MLVQNTTNYVLAMLLYQSYSTSALRRFISIIALIISVLPNNIMPRPYHDVAVLMHQNYLVNYRLGIDTIYLDLNATILRETNF